MESPSKATPRPWRHATLMGYGPGNEKVFHCGLGLRGPAFADEQEANAALIVQAVNFRETLLEELRHLLEEVAYWRRETAARLQMLTWQYRGAEKGQAGDDRLAEIRGEMRPIIAAFEGADEAEWHPRCDECGEFIRPGDRVVAIAFDEDEASARAHAACFKAEEHESFIDHETTEAEIRDAARAICYPVDAPDPEDDKDELVF